MILRQSTAKRSTRSAGIARALVQEGLEGPDPRFRGGDLLCLLPGNRAPMDDQLPHDEGRLLPAGRLQRQPFWQGNGGNHRTPAGLWIWPLRP